MSGIEINFDGVVNVLVNTVSSVAGILTFLYLCRNAIVRKSLTDTVTSVKKDLNL